MEIRTKEKIKKYLTSSFDLLNFPPEFFRGFWGLKYQIFQLDLTGNNSEKCKLLTGLGSSLAQSSSLQSLNLASQSVQGSPLEFGCGRESLYLNKYKFWKEEDST